MTKLNDNTVKRSVCQSSSNHNIFLFESLKRSTVENHLTSPPFFQRAPSNRAGWKHRETSLPFLLLRSHSAELLWCRWLPEGRQRPDTGTTCGSPTVHHRTDLQTFSLLIEELGHDSFIYLSLNFASGHP